MTPSDGSPDYFNTCSGFTYTGVPNNQWGFQYPHSGDGYCGILLYQFVDPNTREYIEIPLSDTLQSKKCYHFEMYVNLGNRCGYTCNDIQIYFSDTILDSIADFNCIPKPFQIGYTGVNFDSLSWTMVSGDYTAVGGERFLTIGNFKYDSLSNITLISNSALQANAYVYIDDVSLTKISCTVGINETVIESQNVYPNPFSSQLTFSLADNEQKTVSLYNFLGQQVLQHTFTNSATMSTEQLASGIYFYELRNDKATLKTGKVVKQ